MYHLVYVSSAVSLFSDADLKALLDISRKNNSECGISGLLLYLEGNFIQVLEGEKDVVIQTHTRIGKDPRHHGLITLLQGDIEQREFGGWSMGFRNIQGKEAENLPGYSDYLYQRDDPAKQKSSVLRMLDTFKNINR